MSTIVPNYRTVQQLLDKQSYSIDEYQREYKWEKKHIDELLSDLQGRFVSCFRLGDGTEDVGNYEEYFLGSIIVSKRNNTKYLIDGQQRITSLTLLLICLYRATPPTNSLLIQSISPLIFGDNFGKLKFNLDVAERLPVLQALFKGQPFNPEGKDESTQTMFARYQDIEQNDLIADLGDALPHFAYWLMGRVGLIEIVTDNDNYAYSIFESMNDRGKPLSPVDMLKAYLLAPVEEVNQRQNANLEWKKQVLELISWGNTLEPERDASCIKAWIRSQYAETIRERKAGATDKDWELIGTVFHRWVRDNRLRLSLGNQSSNVNMISVEFPFFAKAYRTILNASQNYTSGLEAIYYNAHNDFTWQSTVLLAPLVSSDSDETVRRKLAVTATYLDIWLMRRVINYIRVGYSNASYPMYLLCNAIRRKPIDELVKILLKRTEEDEVTFQGIPTKDRGGVDKLALNQFSRRYIFHLLARMTAFTEAGAGRSDAFDKYVDRNAENPYDIEHIWANDLTICGDKFVTEQEFQEWRNHIASLLLLPADVNRSLQDKAYSDKVPHYAKQNFYAASLAPSVYDHQPQFKQFLTAKNLKFSSFEKFGKKEQLARRTLVAALVNEIWSPHRLTEAAS